MSIQIRIEAEEITKLLAIIAENDGDLAKKMLNSVLFQELRNPFPNDLLKSLIKDPRVNPAFNDNQAIKFASDHGYDEIVEILLTNPKVGPHAQDNYSIRYASGNGHDKVVALLLKDPRVDPTVQNNNALKCAARNGHTEVVKLLLQDSRVDPNSAQNNPLKLAAENNQINMVMLLLSDPRVVPDDFIFRWAIDKGHSNVVSKILESLSPEINAALVTSLYKGYTEIVKLLLADERVDPTWNDNKAIRVASKKGYTEIVKRLLSDSRVNPEAFDNEAIKSAYKNNHIEVIKLLIPRVDLPKILSTVTDTKVHNFVKQFDINPLTKEQIKKDYVKKIKEEMQRYGITGIFNNENGETVFISDSQLLTF